MTDAPVENDRNEQAADDAEAPRRPVGRWSRLDTGIAAVLGANLVLLGVVALLPQETTEPVAPGPVAEKTKPGVAPQGPKTGSGVLAPRHALFEKAHRLAVGGDVSGAIAALEELLRREPRMAATVRRTVYLQLAYYCGLEERTADARRWHRLARTDLELGLVPGELWRLADDSFESGEWAEARRYMARFLLQEGQLSDELEKKVPVAYLRLADGYRNEAGGGAKKP